MGTDALHAALLALAREVEGPLVALDTSGPVGSLCTVAWRPDEVTEHSLTALAMPSEALATQLARSLDAAQLEMSALRALVVTLGPGSFTGLRVGLALAKGIAFGASVPIIGVSSLATLALSCAPGRVVALRDARRGELFVGAYDVAEDSVTPLMQDACLAPETLVARVAGLGGPWRWVSDDPQPPPGLSDGAARIIEPVVPRAAAALAVAAPRLRRADYDVLDSLVPRYLRLSEPERVASQSADSRQIA